MGPHWGAVFLHKLSTVPQKGVIMPDRDSMIFYWYILRGNRIMADLEQLGIVSTVLAQYLCPFIGGNIRMIGCSWN